MKHFLSMLLAMCFIYQGCGQKSFDGYVKYATEIETYGSAPDYFQEYLENKYGNRLIIKYERNGDFVRKHVNSGPKGNKEQIYDADKGLLSITMNDTNAIETIDLREMSIDCPNKTITKNTQIGGQAVECVCYEGTSMYKQNISIKYCYSKESPRIDPELFKNYNDFYFYDFLKHSKRIYLLFSLKTDDFKLTYTAYDISE